MKQTYYHCLQVPIEGGGKDVLLEATKVKSG